MVNSLALSLWEMVVKPTVLISTVVGVVVIGTSFNVFWSTWGWQTPNDHSADIVQLESEHDSVTSAVMTQLKVNRDEWWCDEEAESLDDLLVAKDGGDSTAVLDQEILEQRKKMDDTECHRFDKD